MHVVQAFWSDPSVVLLDCSHAGDLMFHVLTAKCFVLCSAVCVG